MLKFLKHPLQADFVLWLIEGDIGDLWHAYLYVAAGNQKAIVSTARFNAVDMVAKEASHEIGHLLGLNHCQGNCVMHASKTVDQVVKKSDLLCEACGEFLRRENLGLAGKARKFSSIY